MQYQVELTDTFGGEANYSWVTRKRVTLKDSASDRAIVRAAKRAVGLNGVRGTTTIHADEITFRPYGRAVVMFAHWAD